MKVVLGARRTDMLQQAVADIRAAGGHAEAVTMDVTREADAATLVETAQRAFGRLDIMICNAGFGYYGTVEETPPDVMQRMMDVNFMGTYHGTRAALPVFRTQGHGHLIFVSSIVGRRGIAQMSGYSATKAAQAGFCEALRTEFAGTNIHVSIVYPVSTETEFRGGDRGVREKAGTGGVSAPSLEGADDRQRGGTGFRRHAGEEVRTAAEDRWLIWTPPAGSRSPSARPEVVR